MSGGWSQHAGLAPDAARDRVEDGALPTTRRAYQHDDERRVQRGRPHTDVPMQVVGQLASTFGSRLAPGMLGEPAFGQCLEPVDERAKIRRGRVDHAPEASAGPPIA